jgi:hypothetical protein
VKRGEHLEQLLHAARSCVRPSAQLRELTELLMSLRVRGFEEWQATSRLTRFEIKFLLLLFLAFLVGLVTLWLVA